MTTSLSLRALLTGSVDYAGLFPPAGLALGPALSNHAAYARDAADAWMLGCFVLPAAQLRATGTFLGKLFDSTCPLRISALGLKSNSAAAFLENLHESLGELAHFRQARGAEIVLEQFEAPLPPEMPSSLALRTMLAQADGLIEALLPGPLRVFWEVPLTSDLPAILRGLAEHNAHVSPATQPFGVKLRTGGVAAAAFPAPAQLAGALAAARDAGVRVKFTAGLHHPLRHFDEALSTHMHGFLNVFAAGVLAREHRLDAAETAAILEDEQAENFRFDAAGFAWRDRRRPRGAGGTPGVRHEFWLLFLRRAAR